MVCGPAIVLRLRAALDYGLILFETLNGSREPSPRFVFVPQTHRPLSRRRGIWIGRHATSRRGKALYGDRLCEVLGGKRWAFGRTERPRT